MNLPTAAENPYHYGSLYLGLTAINTSLAFCPKTYRKPFSWCRIPDCDTVHNELNEKPNWLCWSSKSKNLELHISDSTGFTFAHKPTHHSTSCQCQWFHLGYTNFFPLMIVDSPATLLSLKYVSIREETIKTFVHFNIY